MASKALQPADGRCPPRRRDWNIEDVIEASGKMPAEALQAAFTDVRQRFNINKKTLVAARRRRRAGSVIDLMSPSTFPKRFVVERAGGGAPIGVSTGMGCTTRSCRRYVGAYANCYSDRYYGYRLLQHVRLGTDLFAVRRYYPYQYKDYNYFNPGGGWVAVDSNPDSHRLGQRSRRQWPRLHADSRAIA